MAKKLQLEIVVDDKGSVVVKQFEKNIKKAVKNSKREMNTLNKAVGKLTPSFTQVGVAVAAAGVALGLMTKEIVQAGVAFDSLNRSFKAIFGSAEAAAKEMAFINKNAKELGLSLPVLEDAYKNIAAAARGTALEGKELRKIFSSITKAGAVLGMSAADTEGSLRALSQMISKGNVQAEELRGQLGERLPGAFQMAAEAMGVSTQELNKMLEQGQVLATDLLPKLANILEQKYGKAAVDAGKSARAAFVNFSNAILQLKREMADSGIMEGFADAVRDITELITSPEAKSAFNDMADDLALLVPHIQDATKALIKMSIGMAKVIGLASKMTAALMGGREGQANWQPWWADEANANLAGSSNAGAITGGQFANMFPAGGEFGGGNIGAAAQNTDQQRMKEGLPAAAAGGGGGTEYDALPFMNLSRTYETEKERRMKISEEMVEMVRAQLEEEQELREIANEWYLESEIMKRDQREQDLQHAREIEMAMTDISVTESEKRAAAEKEANRQKMMHAQMFAQYTASTMQSLYEATGKNSKKLFKLMKAARIGEAVMNTYSSAVGAYNAMVNIPYVGPVLAVAAAAAAVAAGLANVQKIRQQKMHSGGIVGGHASQAGVAQLRNDEREVTLQTGEGVLSRSDVSVLGGPEGLRDIVRNGGVGSGHTVNINVDGNLISSPESVRDFAMIMNDELQKLEKLGY